MNTLTLIIIIAMVYAIISKLFDLLGITDWLYRLGFKLGLYIKKFVQKRDQSPADPIEKYNRLPEYQDGEWYVQYKILDVYILINNTPYLTKNGYPVYPEIIFHYNGAWHEIPGSHQPVTQIPNVRYYINYVDDNCIKYNIGRMK